MLIEYDLPLTSFEGRAVKAAFNLYLAKCREETAAGNRHPYVAHEKDMQHLLKALEKAELEAVASLERR